MVAVFTGADLDLKPSFPFFEVSEHCARPPLAVDRVRFVGEPVAVVIAETAAQARDSADLVDVEYAELPCVVDAESALAPGAVQLLQGVPGNLVEGVRTSEGDALHGAVHVVRARFVNQRLAVAPMEGNAVLAVPGGDYDLTVQISTQTPHLVRELIAADFGLAEDRVRVVAPHVGGGFGGKAFANDCRVVIGAALRLQRPVTFAESRPESLLSMQGRAQVQYVELGLDQEGRFTGLRCRMIGDCGAYGGFGGTFVLGTTASMASGVYRIPRLQYAACAVLTNTPPTGPVRGAGRPEATSMIERIVDIAADQLGLDPVELRRRNLIDQFPHTTQAGATYDTGDYEGTLDHALASADVEAIREEQRERRSSGAVRQLGVGISCYVEVTAGGGEEFGEVSLDEEGTVHVRCGTSAHGQGHATTFSMLVADRLGLPVTAIRYEQSDTAVVARGVGTWGSRSLQLGGSAVAGAAGLVLDQARDVAARMLEATVEDVELRDGGFGVVGVPASVVSWTDVARHAIGDGKPLRAEHDFTSDNQTYPFGTHVSVVEVDVETGGVTPLRHIAVDDCGRIVNPLIVAGQQHGGIAQGIAQALWEEFIYDGAGNPLTSTFVDYCLPTTADLPSFEVANTVTETPHNPLGAKGTVGRSVPGRSPLPRPQRAAGPTSRISSSSPRGRQLLGTAARRSFRWE